MMSQDPKIPGELKSGSQCKHRIYNLHTTPVLLNNQ